MGNLAELQRNWDGLGKSDPLWAVLTKPGARNGHWNVEEFFETGRKEIARAIEYADRFGYPVARSKALDFGCGVGRLTQALGAHFDTVVGVDIAPSMLEEAKRYNRLGERCSYLLNAADDLAQLPSGAYDFIYSSIVLQHMEPQYSLRYIAEFVRLLTPGGLALFDIPAEAVRPKPMAREAFQARITSDLQYVTAAAGEPFAVTAHITNTSPLNWTEPINLGNHWYLPSDLLVSADDGRSGVPVPLAAGASAAIDVVATAPNRAGTYLLELDLVQEHVSWFSQQGAQTLRIPVTVTAKAEEREDESDEWFVPKMDMFGVSPLYVVATVLDQGGKLVAIDPSRAGGHAWLGYRYAVTKPH